MISSSKARLFHPPSLVLRRHPGGGDRRSLQPLCGLSHRCETVQTSASATLLGVPVAVLGLISYAVIFISLRLGGEGPLLTGYALTLIAVAFTLYLTPNYAGAGPAPA